MKEFKPIAMRCNQQQYDEIKQILLDNGCKCRLDDTFDERPYLVNNFSSNRNSINNTINSLKDDYNRTVFETWNKDVFLEYCGIETKIKYKVGDWVITKGYFNDYDGVPLKINNISKNGDCYFDKTNYYGWQPNHNFHLRHIVRKAEPHEIPNNQNNKTDFIVGKWYKLPKHNWYLKHLNMTNNKWFYNERIMCNLNDYDFVIDWCDNNTEFTLLTDLSEIQQYLPDGHPDKVFKQPNLNDLLEEAKKRYPVGTKFYSAYNTNISGEVKSNNYYIYNNTDITINYLSGHSVYSNGKWAEIIETAKPVETKSKYQIAAEKALERFKDIQIGDKYMTIYDQSYIAERLPKIISPNSEYCYIDCGASYLWKYDKPDKFGYKINNQNSTEINVYPLPPNPITTNKQLIEKIQPIQLIRKKKIVMDTKINPIKSINTNLKIKNQKLWN